MTHWLSLSASTIASLRIHSLDAVFVTTPLQSESVAEIEAESHALVEELGTDGMVSLDRWLAAVGSKRIRGTR